MTRNVLLVTIDSLRRDRAVALQSAGHVPTMAALAEAGTSFEAAFATGPGTTPSFPGLLTGTYALDHGGLGPLSSDRPSLAGNVRASGRATGGFHSNPFLSTHFNYDRGFDRFEDYQNPLMGVATRIFPRGIELNNPRLRRLDDVLHLTGALKRSYQLVRGKPRPYVGAEVITDDAVAWLDETDDPFFCWAHFMDVHHPCHPPESYRCQFDVEDVSQTAVSSLYSRMNREPSTLTDDDVEQLLRLYDAAAAYVDDQIGRLVRHLRDTGRFDDTLVVITSDHGELFGEHGLYGKPARLFDELLRVPLVVVNGPDELSAATEDLVSLLDVPPLVHDVLGIDVPPTYRGRRPGRDPPRDHVIAEHEVGGAVLVGARSRDWLYEADEIAGEHRLFDVRGGDCTRVSIEDHPESHDLREVVLDRLAGLDVTPSAFEDRVEGDVRDRLEDLGYL